jgi:hypothetical protein
MSERVRKLRGRIAPAAVPAPSADYGLFLKLLNNERIALDKADREAMGNRASDFGGGPREPEPLTEEEERALAEETEWDGESYLGLLLILRAEIDDDHPKAAVLDDTIAKERKEQEKVRTA